MTNGTPTTRLAKPVLAYDFFRFLRRPQEARAAAAQEARQVQAERDDARKVAAEAREQAARLAGQLEALQRQQDKAEAAEKATKAPKGKGGE